MTLMIPGYKPVLDGLLYVRDAGVLKVEGIQEEAVEFLRVGRWSRITYKELIDNILLKAEIAQREGKMTMESPSHEDALRCMQLGYNPDSTDAKQQYVEEYFRQKNSISQMILDLPPGLLEHITKDDSALRYWFEKAWDGDDNKRPVEAVRPLLECLSSSLSVYIKRAVTELPTNSKDDDALQEKYMHDTVSFFESRGVEDFLLSGQSYGFLDLVIMDVVLTNNRLPPQATVMHHLNNPESAEDGSGYQYVQSNICQASGYGFAAVGRLATTLYSLTPHAIQSIEDVTIDLLEDITLMAIQHFNDPVHMYPIPEEFEQDLHETMQELKEYLENNPDLEINPSSNN